MKARSSIIALATLFATVPAAAQQQSVPNAVLLESEEEEVRRYSVELIVFEYAGSAAGTTELFDPDPSTDPIFDDEFLVTLRDDRTLRRVSTVNPQTGEVETRLQGADEETLEEIPTLELAGVRLLEPEEFQMTSAWERLDNLDAYTPLLHTGWEQPTVEQEETVELSLRRIGDPPLRLSGTVSLYLSRFLHLVVDVALEEKQPVRTTVPQQRFSRFGDNEMRSSFSFDRDSIRPSLFYRIKEDRIVRNNEVRYYDHPKFGVIARVTRIEEETPEDVDTTDDLLPGTVN